MRKGEEGGRKFRKCNHYYPGSSKCGKRVHTKGEEVIAEFSHHNHTTSPAEIEALKVRSTIRRSAIESRDAPALIIAEATAKLNPAAIAQLPPLYSMKRTIRGERKIELACDIQAGTLILCPAVYLFPFHYIFRIYCM